MPPPFSNSDKPFNVAAFPGMWVVSGDV